MKIALIQQAAGPDFSRNLESGVERFKIAAEAGAQLIAYAELAFQPFFPQKRRSGDSKPQAETVPGPTTERFSQLAQEYGVVTVLNLYEEDAGRFFDSSPVIDADGSLLGVARMVHIMDGPCFHEQDYYHPGDVGSPVFETAVGKVGVAICYDRHYPEYMRALGVKGAELVVIPQAGAVGEWPEGMYEAEVRVASMQNGYFCALANRVGAEECLTFAGESFVTDPTGKVLARAATGSDEILYAELDLASLEQSPARKHFLRDRRPGIYPL